MPEPITLIIGAIKLGTAIAGKIAALAKGTVVASKSSAAIHTIAHSATTASGVVEVVETAAATTALIGSAALIGEGVSKTGEAIEHGKPASAAFNAAKTVSRAHGLIDDIK